MHQRGYIQDVYTLPDQSRVYLVYAPSKGVPDLVLGVSPYMATVGQEDIRAPCINWKALPSGLKYAQYFQPSRSPLPSLTCAAVSRAFLPGGGTGATRATPARRRATGPSRPPPGSRAIS